MLAGGAFDDLAGDHADLVPLAGPGPLTAQQSAIYIHFAMHNMYINHTYNQDSNMAFRYSSAANGTQTDLSFLVAGS